MNYYRIKQMNWKVLDDDFDYTDYEQCEITNILFTLAFDKSSKRYKASYCIDEYYNEGRKEFKTFDEATAWLQRVLEYHVLDFLDKIVTE